MRSWCAGEFVTAVDFTETFIPGPCSFNCSSHPKEQGLALPHCGLSSGEPGQGAGPGPGVQITWSAPKYLWQLCTGGVVGCPLHGQTKIHCPTFRPLMLFSWCSCWLLHRQFISLGSSSNRSFLQKATAFVALPGKALCGCSTVCAGSESSVSKSPV